MSESQTTKGDGIKEMLDLLVTPNPNPERRLGEDEIPGMVRHQIQCGKSNVGVALILRNHGVDWPLEKIYELCETVRKDLGIHERKTGHTADSILDIFVALFIMALGCGICFFGIYITDATEGRFIFYGLILLGAVLAFQGLGKFILALSGYRGQSGE